MREKLDDKAFDALTQTLRASSRTTPPPLTEQYAWIETHDTLGGPVSWLDRALYTQLMVQQCLRRGMPLLTVEELWSRLDDSKRDLEPDDTEKPCWQEVRIEASGERYWVPKSGYYSLCIETTGKWDEEASAPYVFRPAFH